MHEEMPGERRAVPAGGCFLFRAGLGGFQSAPPGLLGSRLARSSRTVPGVVEVADAETLGHEDPLGPQRHPLALL